MQQCLQLSSFFPNSREEWNFRRAYVALSRFKKRLFCGFGGVIFDHCPALSLTAVQLSSFFFLCSLGFFTTFILVLDRPSPLFYR
ncbi:hypothetical protein K443DRAFT_310245 [Laccaria amethystina LaAM-08-1]|uniref:Uncharacterized protein n=1 Tax=Laccaria amethystina LaAM-08-1 TaxID=1095629 RepID=A0A0C9XX00_9AGAR|nr:hypothetical protein K443DRAFT_310245 [Laccaria amethystina LaAM-08-1]